MFIRSNKLLKKSEEIIVNGIKGMHRLNSQINFPSYFVRGQASYIWDLDGNKYIDFILGKGPYILGYANEEVNQAVINQIQEGNIFPSGNPLHSQLAIKLNSLLVNSDKMLFYKTGSCATEAAVMIARRYSKKKKILSSGYHGWHPWCSCEDDSFIDFEYSLNKLEAYIKRFKDDVAAVFLTPECYYFNEGYYQELESICLKNNVLFILDEVKTGFRVGLAGFQGRYGIAPDLSVYSKAISNGYSIAVLTGKGDIMRSAYELHTAGTYDTEVVPFAAALATISALEGNSYLDKIDLLGQWFVQELNKIFETSKLDIHTIWAGGSFRFWIKNKDLDRRFYEVSAENGLLFYPFDNSYLSASHDKETLLLSLDKMEKIAHDKLSFFMGEYSEFKESDLIQNLNLKGFLNNYPGKDGRSYA